MNIPVCDSILCQLAQFPMVQVAAPVIILAFLVVAGTCAIMIPVMLWVFQLYDKGWNWQYAALFGSMLGATDAVAIIATMKSSKAFLHHTLNLFDSHANCRHPDYAVGVFPT